MSKHVCGSLILVNLVVIFKCLFKIHLLFFEITLYHFPFLLIPLKPLTYPSLFFFKFMPSFFINCFYMCIHIIHILSLFPREVYSSQFQHSPFDCSYLCRIEASSVFLFPHIYWGCPCSAHILAVHDGWCYECGF